MNVATVKHQPAVRPARPVGCVKGRPDRTLQVITLLCGSLLVLQRTLGPARFGSVKVGPTAYPKELRRCDVAAAPAIHRIRRAVIRDLDGVEAAPVPILHRVCGFGLMP